MTCMHYYYIGLNDKDAHKQKYNYNTEGQKMVRFFNKKRTSYQVNDVIYSYSTPVARISGNDLLIDDVFYSRTTSKQLGIIANRLGLNKIKVDNLFN